ncbi:hypothetical protein PR048_029983 [Dryococelus australis]|uniref:Uncharacterized protein n=1 Tax=Dryococelus australis TaxID=614101 RepID=A0ABQ9G7P1_9NEOP|nr:hypothetical protein PR048_029983 [Dryococelus australis]
MLAKAKRLKWLDREFFLATRTLDVCVAEKTANIVDALLDNCKKMAARNFLLKEPSRWSEDAIYKLFQEKGAQMKMVNDRALFISRPLVILSNLELVLCPFDIIPLNLPVVTQLN